MLKPNEKVELVRFSYPIALGSKGTLNSLGPADKFTAEVVDGLLRVTDGGGAVTYVPLSNVHFLKATATDTKKSEAKK